MAPFAIFSHGVTDEYDVTGEMVPRDYTKQ